MLEVDIIKHSGKRPSEKYDREKLKRSIIAACLSSRTPEGLAEEIAENVCQNVEQWLERRQVVTSNDLRTVATRSFQLRHPEAAYIYDHNRVII